MAAPKGNRFWEARATHGRRKKYLKPEDLWKQCCEYFVWIEDNPLEAAELVKYQGEATVKRVPKMRAMTIGGLLIFIDCARRTWDNYKANEDFVEVITRVEEIIYEQKFAGAAAELLNPNIIARDLGLSDKREQELSGPGGGAIPVATTTLTAEMDPVEASRIYKELLTNG
ncbi:DNA-packaging protein [Pseudomaricurvus alkylphenolicus]|uniref:DNA-packaging protein n=1 Tax=Pseudomaricurvus alkylphenolicus TaxID=1306991 RepID=UPI00142186BB|nr:DNA-packaging protein [Pseudomaricurvus alkylphenolicus]NIB43804.1 DNA-packaging protein [Pseudomaricurvus alkylphenolicus]